MMRSNLQRTLDLMEYFAELAWICLTQPETAVMPNEAEFYMERAKGKAKQILRYWK